MRNRKKRQIADIQESPQWCNTTCNRYQECNHSFQNACQLANSSNGTQEHIQAGERTFLSLYSKIPKKKLIGNSLHSYVENSHEYNAKGVKEIRILTNDVTNYDCATLPLISIQLNILRGITYTYYVPNKTEYDTLLYKVISGINKTEEAINNIDKWTRYYCSNAVFTRAILQEFVAKSADDLVKALSFDERQDNVHKIREVISDIERVDFDLLKNWLACERDMDFNEVDNNQHLLNNISDIVSRFTSPATTMRIKLIELINNMADLVSLSKSVISGQVEQYKQILNKLKIPQSIIEWLSAKPLDEGTIKSRLLYKIIDEDSFCYNFCLILNQGGSINGASWYLASNREQLDVVEDNYVLLHIFDREDAEKVKSAFENIN